MTRQNPYNPPSGELRDPPQERKSNLFRTKYWMTAYAVLSIPLAVYDAGQESNLANVDPWLLLGVSLVVIGIIAVTVYEMRTLRAWYPSGWVAAIQTTFLAAGGLALLFLHDLGVIAFPAFYLFVLLFFLCGGIAIPVWITERRKGVFVCFDLRGTVFVPKPPSS
jgi:hypothetical protein